MCPLSAGLLFAGPLPDGPLLGPPAAADKPPTAAVHLVGHADPPTPASLHPPPGRLPIAGRKEDLPPPAVRWPAQMPRVQLKCGMDPLAIADVLAAEVVDALAHPPVDLTHNIVNAGRPNVSRSKPTKLGLKKRIGRHVVDPWSTNFV